MLKTIFSAFVFIIVALQGSAQKLNNFTATLQSKEAAASYLSITGKKAYSAEEAKANKSTIDLGLVVTKIDNKLTLEWYNLSGKDEKIPAELVGTKTVISSLSFDKEQFDKCNTQQDLQKMTGHITNSSFVHFASVSDDLEKSGIRYHCFLVQREDGKRALLWIEAGENNQYKVFVKAQ